MRKEITLRNSLVELVQSLEGSAFTSFKFLDKDINPLAWNLPEERLPDTNIGNYPFRGHFLCLGTWGYPTAGEKKAGVKFYGEVNTEFWETDQIETKNNNQLLSKSSCNATNEKLALRRQVKLSQTSPVVSVCEEVTNHLPIGRPYNILQHATIGGPFLEPRTILDSNASKGFYQNGDFVRASYDDTEATSYDWPFADLRGTRVDIRKSGDIHKTYNSAHIFPDEIKFGWATLANEQLGLLIGYIWDLAGYPWLNIWHQFENGRMEGRGIEFATCGYWQSFEWMMTHDSRFFGRNSLEFIDAGQTKRKRYHMFLLKIEDHFKAVNDVKIDGSHLHVEVTYAQTKKIHTLDLPA